MASDYARIWAGNAASNLSDGLTFVAVPLIATALSRDPFAIAGLTVVYTVPRLAGVLGIGVLVDRVDRRRLLAAANLLRAAVFLGLALLLLAGVVTLPVLYLAYGVVGLIEATSDTAVVAIVPDVVPAGRLDRANAQITGTQLVLDEFVGPPLGGLLLAVAPFLPIGLCAVACGAAGLCFLRLGDVHRAGGRGATRASGSTDLRTDLRAGLLWLRADQVVTGLVLVGGLASVAYSLPFSYLVLFAERVLGLDSTGYGLLMAFSALGGLLGSVVAARLRRCVGYGWAIAAALGLGAVSITLTGLTSSVPVAGVALAAYICHAVVWNVLATSLRQRIVPAELLGRVGAVGRLAGYLGLALGAVAGGWLAATTTLRVPFVVAGVLFAGCALVAVRLRGPIRAWEAR